MEGQRHREHQPVADRSCLSYRVRGCSFPFIRCPTAEIMFCMTFLENVLAGLVVEVLLLGVYRLRTLWAVRRPTAHPSQKSESS